jgi:hypothetical protein
MKSKKKKIANMSVVELKEVHAKLSEAKKDQQNQLDSQYGREITWHLNNKLQKVPLAV